MAKCILLWEIDMTKIPVDPKERLGGYTMLVNMVKNDFEKGILKDWGEFSSHLKGYAIMEGTEEEVYADTMKYDPYVKFTVYPVVSIDFVAKTIETLSQA